MAKIDIVKTPILGLKKFVNSKLLIDSSIWNDTMNQLDAAIGEGGSGGGDNSNISALLRRFVISNVPTNKTVTIGPGENGHCIFVIDDKKEDYVPFSFLTVSINTGSADINSKLIPNKPIITPYDKNGICRLLLDLYNISEDTITISSATLGLNFIKEGAYIYV